MRWWFGLTNGPFQTMFISHIISAFECCLAFKYFMSRVPHPVTVTTRIITIFRLGNPNLNLYLPQYVLYVKKKNLLFWILFPPLKLNSKSPWKWMVGRRITLSETNIAPENWWLEDEISFWGPVSFREGNDPTFWGINPPIFPKRHGKPSENIGGSHFHGCIFGA